MKILMTVGLGLGTVFVGLICMILLIELMHLIAVKFSTDKTQEIKLQSLHQDIDHSVLVTLIAAAVAEEIGKDISAIRINSIRKI
jgi:Na+-transporting methylmalonyl-CoA/oxaloacetate decarboxylase gamma subunit